MGHKHAALMALYAQDAMETDTPWERWQWHTGKNLWEELSDHPSWSLSLDYRRKPSRLSVYLNNGDEVSWPEPYTDALLSGSSYWSVGLTEVHHHNWRNFTSERAVKEQGLLYLTKEDAEEALVARQLIFTQGMK